MKVNGEINSYFSYKCEQSSKSLLLQKFVWNYNKKLSLLFAVGDQSNNPSCSDGNKRLCFANEKTKLNLKKQERKKVSFKSSNQNILKVKRRHSTLVLSLWIL